MLNAAHLCTDYKFVSPSGICTRGQQLVVFGIYRLFFFLRNSRLLPPGLPGEQCPLPVFFTMYRDHSYLILHPCESVYCLATVNNSTYNHWCFCLLQSQPHRPVHVWRQVLIVPSPHPEIQLWRHTTPSTSEKSRSLSLMLLYLVENVSPPSPRQSQRESAVSLRNFSTNGPCPVTICLAPQNIFFGTQVSIIALAQRRGVALSA